LFIEHSLCADEVRDNKIIVTDEEVDTTLKKLLKDFAERKGLDSREIIPEKLLRQAGLPGSLAALRRHLRDSLGLLKLLQKDNKMPANTEITDQRFQLATSELLEKLVNQ